MNICIATEGYPYAEDSQFAFVEQLCVAMSKQNVNVTIISPQSWFHIVLGKDKAHPQYRIDQKGGVPIHVYRPLFILAPYRFWRFNDFSFKLAVTRQFKKLKTTFDVCYGHFWNNAYYISGVAKKNNIPLFVASGEGNFDDLTKKYKSKTYQSFSKNVRGVICVSSSCRDISVEYGLTTKDKCIVAPNSIDETLFKVMDKRQLREKYGYPTDAFIIAFVGGLINRKGSNRVSEAVKILAEEGIKVNSIFIGKGQGPENLVPDCEGVLHCGPVEHSRIPEYLNMADVFVLPTLNEGCCNAIIEAMACGLPIISSDKPFNYDVLNESNSILVDPNNVPEIASAIKKVYLDEELRSKMSNSAIETAKGLTIDKRAKKIISYIKDIIATK